MANGQGWSLVVAIFYPGSLLRGFRGFFVFFDDLDWSRVRVPLYLLARMAVSTRIQFGPILLAVPNL